MKLISQFWRKHVAPVKAKRHRETDRHTEDEQSDPYVALCGLKVMAKVKVFVHAANVHVYTDARAMTLAPWTFVLAR